MKSRAPILFLVLAGAIAGLALFVFLAGDDPRNARTAARDVVAVQPTGDEGATVDLQGPENRARPQRSQNLVSSALARAQGLAGDSAGDEPEVPRGPYQGRILDHLGRPLATVEVTLRPWEEAGELLSRSMRFGANKGRLVEATTDDHGHFSVDAKRSLGNVLGVSAAARGYLDQPIKYLLAEAQGNDLGDIILEPAVIVGGWVRSRDGRPIAGARVRRIELGGDAMVDVLDEIGFSGMLGLVTTDMDGHFELPHERGGRIVLLAEHDDILRARYEGPTKRGGDVLQDIVIHAQRAGLIRGKIAGYPRGRVRGIVAAAALDPSADKTRKTGISAVMSARISPAGEHQGKVGADGSFTIGGLTPGARYELRLIERRRFVDTVVLSDTVEARADGGPAALRFDPGAEVTLRIIDRETKRPIEVMTLSARWPDGVSKLQLTSTGKDIPKRFPGGELTLHELRPEGGQGTLTITVEAPGYLRAKTAAIEVGDSGSTDAGVLELDQAPRFRFRVVDAATRDPISRAKVSLRGVSTEDADDAIRVGEVRRQAWAKTDRDGLCELAALGEETLTLTVRARDYAKYVQMNFDQSSGRLDVLVELYRGGAILVTVLDADGSRVREDTRVRCRTVDADAKWVSGKAVDDRGQALFGELHAGAYQARAVSGGQPTFGRDDDEAEEDRWESIHVVDGRVTEVEIILPATGGLVGTVTLGNGPAVGARVSVVEEADADETERFILVQDQFSGFDRSRGGDTTGPDGAFELTDLAPGTYALLVRHPEAAMVTRETIEIGLGVSTVHVEILPTAVEGRVVGPEGGPIEGALISVRRYDADSDAEVRLTRSFLGISNSVASTDADGRFRVRSVRADIPLQIVVRAEGFTDAVSPSLTVRERETHEIEALRLDLAGAILVTVVGDDVDRGLYFATAEREDGNASQGKKIGLLRGGRARIEGLRAGRWVVRGELAGRRRGQDNDGLPESQSTVVEVKAGETTEIEIDLAEQ